MDFVEFLGWAREIRKIVSAQELRKLMSIPYINLETCQFCNPYITSNRSVSRDKIREIYSKVLGCENCEQCSDCCDCNFCENCQNKTREPVCNNCESCENCCDCHFCNHCSENVYSDKVCGDCDNCHECCDCIRCDNCSKVVDTDYYPYCSDCNSCESCCDCSENRIDFVKRDIKFFPAEKINKINPSKRFLSVEIEVSSCENGEEINDEVRKWRGSIVKDSSLPSGGFEINTSPAAGDVFVKQITDVCGALRRCSAEANSDCGLHVHIDARDFAYYEINRLISLYAKIEPILFEMIPPSRRNNSTCFPCANFYTSGFKPGKELRKEIISKVYKFNKLDKFSNKKTYKDDKYHGSRYNALNLHSWFYRGTIECRMFGGTTNKDKIINWSIMWALILDYVYSATDKEISELTGNGYKILTEVVLKGQTEIIKFVDKRLKLHGNVEEENDYE